MSQSGFTATYFLTEFHKDYRFTHLLRNMGYCEAEEFSLFHIKAPSHNNKEDEGELYLRILRYRFDVLAFKHCFLQILIAFSC